MLLPAAFIWAAPRCSEKPTLIMMGRHRDAPRSGDARCTEAARAMSDLFELNGPLRASEALLRSQRKTCSAGAWRWRSPTSSLLLASALSHPRPRPLQRAPLSSVLYLGCRQRIAAMFETASLALAESSRPRGSERPRDCKLQTREHACVRRASCHKECHRVQGLSLCKIQLHVHRASTGGSASWTTTRVC